MARDDVAHRGACMDTEEKKYAGGIKRKRRWINTEYKHRIQSHNAHRHCTLPIKKTVCEYIEHGNHEYEG